MKIMYQQRLKNVAATDKRVSLTNEVRMRCYMLLSVQLINFADFTRNTTD
jgi:hypothetical protein